MAQMPMEERSPLSIDDVAPAVLARLWRVPAVAREEGAADNGVGPDEQGLDDMRTMGYTGGND